MTTPDWLCIGSGKAGTTSLAVYLAEHPELFVCPVKEPRHFLSVGERSTYTGPTDEERVNVPLVHDIRRYEELFANRRPDQRAGELSQAYLGSPGVADAIYARNPEMRLFAVLRHPADRAFSSWSAHRRDGFETETSFEQAIADEPERIAAGWSPIWWYTERGWYGRHLARWFAIFPRDQLRVWLYEDLARDPREMLQQVFEFLGVDPTFEPVMKKHHNVSLVPRSHRLSQFVRHPSRARRAVGRLVPGRLRAATAGRVLTLNERRLTFDPATRRRLVEQYAPDIEKLGGLIDRDLSHWLE